VKVTEHYDRATEPLISFEIIPPKRGTSVGPVFEALDKLMAFHPPFIDVTYHAAEAYYEEQADGTLRKFIKRKRPGTVGLCAAIKHRYGVDPVPHLICHGFSREESEDALIELHYLGIDNVLAIRGDKDRTAGSLYPNGTCNEFAIDLVRQVQDMNRGRYLEDIMNAEPTHFCVGVSGYPEKHFEAPNLAYDIQWVKKKVEAGADYIVTQMFFDNAKYHEFVAQCRAAGIEVPIVPGLKVITTPNHLVSLPKHFYLNIPTDLSDAVLADPKRTKEIGVEWCTQQCKELLEHDIPGIHFYVMSDPTPALNVIRGIGR